MTADMKWKLVPVEADDGMIEAGHEKLLEGSEWGRMVSAAEIYDAMLAASPPAPCAEPVALMGRQFGIGEDLLEEGADHETFGIHEITPGREHGNKIAVYGDKALRDAILSFLASPIDPAAIRAVTHPSSQKEGALEHVVR